MQLDDDEVVAQVFEVMEIVVMLDNDDTDYADMDEDDEVEQVIKRFEMVVTDDEMDENRLIDVMLQTVDEVDEVEELLVLVVIDENELVE